MKRHTQPRTRTMTSHIEAINNHTHTNTHTHRQWHSGNMISRRTRKSNMISNFWWSTESCNSQCLYHSQGWSLFSVVFIVIRAQTRKHAFKKHPNTNPDTQHPKRPHPLSHTNTPPHTQQPNTNAKTQPPNTRPSNLTPQQPDPTAQHPNTPTTQHPTHHVGWQSNHDPKKEEAKQHHPTEEKGKTDPKEGKESSTQAAPPNRRQGRQQLHPVHHPKGGAGKAAPLCWNVDLARTPISMKVLDETRRRALCWAAPTSVFSTNQQTTNKTTTCATTCGSGQGNGNVW